jgi:hypothetical protein
MRYQIVIGLAEGPNGQNKEIQIVNIKTNSDCSTEAIGEFARGVSQLAAGCMGYKDLIVDYTVYNDDERRVFFGKL